MSTVIVCEKLLQVSRFKCVTAYSYHHTMLVKKKGFWNTILNIWFETQGTLLRDFL
jgi:hypothetical protein